MRHNHHDVDRPISDGWLADHSASVSLRIARREQWLNQPPQLRQETIARVRRIVAAYPQSYLARHWQDIYI